MKTLMAHKPKFGLGENISYRVVDRNGNAKRFFQLNGFGNAVMRLARLATNPIAKVTDREGNVTASSVKAGFLNYVAAYGVQIPLITGHYTYNMRGANLTTTTGKAGVAGRIGASGSPAAFTYIAIGTGTTAAAIGDTTLQTEITTGGGARAAATVSLVTTDTTNDTARAVVTFTFTAGFAVTEAGLLNAASAGTLLNRQVFSAVNVVSGDTLQVTIDIDVD